LQRASGGTDIATTLTQYLGISGQPKLGFRVPYSPHHGGCAVAGGFCLLGFLCRVARVLLLHDGRPQPVGSVPIVDGARGKFRAAQRHDARYEALEKKYPALNERP